MAEQAKCHSSRHAAEYIHLGWTLKSEFYPDAPQQDEPYEYYLIWEFDEEPKRPATSPDEWHTPPGDYTFDAERISKRN